MIEIVAKNYERFFDLLKIYNIPETEAIFVAIDNINSTQCNNNSEVLTRYNKDLRDAPGDANDWIDYRCPVFIR